MIDLLSDTVSNKDPCVMLPDDLTGSTVLDVGCGSGATARELARRGAAQVVAVDIDDARLDEARDLNRAAVERRIDYRTADLEVALPSGPFDHVVCHNLLHRVRNPIDVLDRLIERTSSSLVLEMTGISAERPSRLLRRDYDAPQPLREAVAQMPLVLVGRDGTPGRKREQKFFFSPDALHNLLMEQRRFFARLDIRPPDADGRFLARATRRQVDHVIAVSGPTGAGKSTFLERLARGDRAVSQLSAVVDHGSLRRYRVTNSDGLGQLGEAQSHLLFHYDLLRPWRRDAAVHGRDEGLHIFDCGQRLDVIVLVAPAPILRARLTAEFARLPDPDARQGRRLREVIGLYTEPERLIARINAWLDFCQSKGAAPKFIDTSDGYRPVAESEWAATIRGTSEP